MDVYSVSFWPLIWISLYFFKRSLEVVKGLVCYEDPGKHVDQDFILVEDYFVYWINQIRGADYYVDHVLIDFIGHLGPSHNQATSDTIHTS